MRILPQQQPWRFLAAIGWIAIVVLSTVVSIAGVHQMRGLTRLRNAQGDHAGQGIGGTLQDALVAAPKTDLERQLRWWRLELQVMDHMKDYDAFTKLWGSPACRAWRLGLSDEMPSQLKPSLAKLTPDLDVFAELIDDGGFNPGMTGFLATDAHPESNEWLVKMAPPRQLKDENDLSSPVRHADLSVVRGLMSGLAARASLSIDGRPDLARMASFHSLYAKPSDLIDAMISLVAFELWDDACMEESLKGHITAADSCVWIDRIRFLDLAKQTADGLRGERLLTFGAMIELANRNRLYLAVPPFIKPGWPTRIWEVMLWWQGPEEIRRSIDLLAETELRLRNGPEQSFDYPAFYKHLDEWPMHAIYVGSMVESGVATQEMSCRARMRRLATLVVQCTGNAAGLPEDGASLRVLLGAQADLLDPGPDRLAIGYARLTESRFVLSVDCDRSTDGPFTPVERYRPRKPSRDDLARAAKLGPPIVPPRTSMAAGMEVWLPRSR